MLLALPSIIAALRNPTVMLCIAAAFFTGYVGIKAYKAGYASAITSQRNATAALSRQLDSLATAQAISRAVDENVREAAYSAAMTDIQNSGAACAVSADLASKLNAIK